MGKGYGGVIDLVNKGFLVWEANALATMPSDIRQAYWWGLLRDREQGFRRAMELGWSRSAFDGLVLDMYYTSDYFVPGTQICSPWAMVMRWRQEANKRGEYEPLREF